MTGRFQLRQNSIQQLEFAATSTRKREKKEQITEKRMGGNNSPVADEVDIDRPVVFLKQVWMVADLAQLHQHVH